MGRPRGTDPRGRAHRAVRLAVQDGSRPPVDTLACAECDRPAAHYHHAVGYDDAQQLTVVPLCPSCHSRHHPKRPLAERPHSRKGRTMHEQLYTVEEVADRLAVHPETVRRWLRDGRLLGYKLGGGAAAAYRIPESAVAKFLATLGEPPAPRAAR